MWADPEVVRYIGGRPFSPQETWSKILRYAGLWTLLGFGYWAVEELSSGTYVDELGFADFRREMEPPITGLPEVGWAFVSRARGQGYATEALRAAVAWGDANIQTKRSVCIIAPENLASIRVAEKCGYRRVSEANYLGQPLLLFARDSGQLQA